MKKILLIGTKDLLLAFRDRAALLLMLLAPFLLTLGMGLATGAFSSSGGTTLQDIPVVLVNQDQAQLGNALVEVFQSSDLQTLLEPTLMDDFAAAKALVDANKTTAALLIPAGFTSSIIPSGGVKTSNEIVKIKLYTNPNTPTSAGVIQTIVNSFLDQAQKGETLGRVAISQMITHGIIQPDQAQAVGDSINAQMILAENEESATKLQIVNGSGAEEQVNFLSFLAPGMALMFLMLTVTNGGRTLLEERNQGTLSRLLVSPTTTGQVLAGKVVGIYLTGVVQMLILIAGTSLLFSLHWGDPLGVFVLVLAAVAGATGWGLILAALARTPGQVSSIGLALVLLFGILGGSFFSTQGLPQLVQIFAHISPNAWGMDAFTTLALGGSLVNILTPVLALLIMGAVLFGVAIIVLHKRGFENA